MNATTIPAPGTLADRRITLSLPDDLTRTVEAGTHIVFTPRCGTPALYGEFGRIEAVNGDLVTIASEALPNGTATFPRGTFNVRIPGITPVN